MEVVAQKTIPDVDLRDPSLYLNRELGMLQFHRRVLEQSKVEETPLLERLRFLTISSSILDEFFEIRVGGIKEQVSYGLPTGDADGLTPKEVLDRIRAEALDIVDEQYRVLNEDLLPRLAAEGAVVFRRDQLDDRQRQWVLEYFHNTVLPVLTPVGLDPAHPFPRILNKSLNFVVSLEGTDAFGRKSTAAVVQAPRILPRLIRLPQEIVDVPFGFVLLSSVIHEHVGELFHGMKVGGCHQFRVTRNSDLWIDEEEVEDLLLALKGELQGRHFGDEVRLEVSDTCSDAMASFLLHQFGLTESDLYRVNGPVNLNRLEALYDLVDRADLKYPAFVPKSPRATEESGGVFTRLQQGDILLHHPYESFVPVLDFLREAARDPNVLAIKQTVYRTGADSSVAKALLEAARAGKEVTAIIELRARFDEAANIQLASTLQEAGARVVYGVVGFKAHAKMLLVVRREGDRLRRYVHLGTGNYNASTARAYTDFSYMTAREDIGEDVHELFQQLTGLGRAHRLRKLLQSPFDLHRRMIERIDAEAEAVRRGREGRIVAKMNSLIEPEIIQALYRASMAGVPIDLVVRGICCLRPGVPGVSENIRVRSIIGRFLEHHRVFHFHAGGERVTYLSSADWMPRNFFRRVEATFPIESEPLRQRVVDEALTLLLADDSQAWCMQPDGSYVRARPAESATPRAAQTELLQSFARV